MASALSFIKPPFPTRLWICRSCRSRSPSLIYKASYATARTTFSHYSAEQKPARTRFAPSPTGYLHLGSLRTALFNYLIAKATHGDFILRIEDTDQARTVPDSEARLSEDLKWAGLEWDEGPDIGGPYGPYRQSERTELYQEHAQRLIQTGHAYRCFCTAEHLKNLGAFKHESGVSGYNRACFYLPNEESDERASKDEAHVIRLKAPQEYPNFKDMVYGTILPKRSFSHVEDVPHGVPMPPVFEDPILIKSDGFPTYHLANVVDDHHMKITHVVRGSEWMSSTPKHVALYTAFGWAVPKFAHVGLLVNSDGTKLSKRDVGTTLKSNVTALREQGILPEALINFVALLGWSVSRPSEMMNMNELIREFSTKFTRGVTAVDVTKLRFFQRVHAEKAVQKNDTAKVDTMIHSIKKALASRPDWISVKSNWEDKILMGRDGDVYIGDILRADSRTYWDGEAFVERNYHFFTHPSEERLSEKLPEFTEWLSRPRIKTGLGQDAISATDLADTLDPSIIDPSAPIIRNELGYTKEIYEGDASKLATEWSIENVRAWTVDSTAKQVERIFEKKRKASLLARALEVTEQDRILMTQTLKTNLLRYLRWAIQGSNSGPGSAASMALLGPAETRRRLERAKEVLEKSQA